MAKELKEISSLARQHTESAIKVLAGIMNQPTSPEAARISAANSLMDRGWGKATQPIAGDDEMAAVRIALIERIIKDPANSNGEGV